VAGGRRRRVLEPLPAHAPVVAEDQLRRRRDVAREHVAKDRLRHRRQYHPPVAGLTRSDVEHVAFLARLRLTEDELDRLESQLNHIVDQYTKLSEIDTSAIPPTAQTIELENILRDDVAGASLPVDDVLRNARLTEGDFIVVPPILGTEGN
jgi:aspartyl-tRNA(Asn)/glutamyl-tRNA(Gln) amidotransferase subunit C